MAKIYYGTNCRLALFYKTYNLTFVNKSYKGETNNKVRISPWRTVKAMGRSI